MDSVIFHKILGALYGGGYLRRAIFATSNHIYLVNEKQQIRDLVKFSDSDIEELCENSYITLSEEERVNYSLLTYTMGDRGIALVKTLKILARGGIIRYEVLDCENPLVVFDRYRKRLKIEIDYGIFYKLIDDHKIKLVKNIKKQKYYYKLNE